MIEAPCKDCKERHSTCHCECEKYITFKIARTEQNETIHQQNVINGTLNEIRYKAKKKGART